MNDPDDAWGCAFAFIGFFVAVVVSVIVAVGIFGGIKFLLK